MDTIISLVALVVSVISLALSFYFWAKSFRPIITAMVKTHKAGNILIAYDLALINSGSIPAKEITLRADEKSIQAALGKESDDESRNQWLACFTLARPIAILHNGERISCSFGTTKGMDEGFWKYKSRISIIIKYRSWLGHSYIDKQEIEIIDSESFTGFSWG